MFTVVTGNGKGKTTTALGYAVKALAIGHRVQMIQFLKGTGYSGELFSKNFLAEKFSIEQNGYPCPNSQDIKNGEILCTKCGICFRENRKPENKFAIIAMEKAWRDYETQPDLIILDEISHTVKHKLLNVEEIIKFIGACKNKNIDLVATGRNMPTEIMAVADLIIECAMIKHPFQQGIDARRGIEY